MNSALGEVYKEPSSKTISTEASFNGDSNEETLNVNEIGWQKKKINEIQNIPKYYLPQQKELQKTLGKVFITKKIKNRFIRNTR